MAAALAAAALLALAGCSNPASEAESLARAKEAAAKNDFARAHLELQNALQQNAYSGEARFLLGSILYRVEQPVLAVVELRKALDQGHPEAIVAPMLAKALLKQGQLKAVLGEFGAKTLPDPEADAELKTVVAQALQASGKPAEAEALLDQVLKSRPGHVQGSLLKARMLADKGDLPAALALVDTVVKAHPAAADAWRAQGDLLLFGRNDQEAAVASYAKALEASPGDPLASKAIIFVLMARNQLDEAEKRLADMRRVLPNDAQTHYFDAQLAFMRGDSKKAKDLIEPVLKAMPDSSWTLVLAGAIELSLARWSQAEAHLAKAVRLYPNLPNARILLARTHLRNGDAVRAIAALEPMLAPRSRPPLAALAVAAEAYLLSGNAQRASELYDLLAKADPQSASAQVGRARAMLARGDADAALAEFVRLAAADEGNTADLGLISLQLQRGRLAEAGTAVDALIAKRPKDPVGHKLKAEIALRQGRGDDARASFEQALALDKTYFPAVAGLAAMDVKQGKTDQARSRFKSLLDARPNHLPTLLALARLEQVAGGSRDSVVGLLQAAVKGHADDPRPHLELINHLLAIGEPRQALSAATEADRAVQNHGDIMLALARAQEASGEVNQALATYGKVVAVRPNFAPAYIGMGELQLRLKDAQGAGNSFRRAKLIQPDSVRVAGGLVRSELLAGRYDAALAQARDLTARRKDLPIGLLLEAEVELVRGRPAAAAEAYATALRRRGNATSVAAMAYDNLLRAGQRERAEAIAAEWMKSHPDDLEFRVSSGHSALLSGDAALAERRFREVVDRQPDHVAALNNLAWLLASQKRPGGVALAERARAKQPESPAVLDTLAQALVVEGQLDRAAEMQRLAIQKRGGSSPTDYNLALARIYLAQGKKDDALAELNKLSALGDTYPRAEEVARLLQTAGK